MTRSDHTEWKNLAQNRGLTDKIIKGDISFLQCGKELKKRCKTSQNTEEFAEKFKVNHEETFLAETKQGIFRFRTKLVWSKIAVFVAFHLVAVYCMFTFDYFQNWKTIFWMWLVYFIAGLGVTAGAHRYWSHRSYKATLPFRIFLATCYLTSGYNRIYDWVRDHRVHHKYTDTPADPHDSTRGFFFSHVGWLMMKKHPQVIEKGRNVDMSDILADPVVRFVDKHFTILKLLGTFIVPSLIPIFGWGETWSRSFISQAIIRYIITIHCGFSVNSVAHLWGMKPYNRSIKPVENVVVSLFTCGEGWHNYHHTFPWDYRAAEWSNPIYNVTTVFLKLSAKLGLISDLKQPSQELINAVAKRQGDGTHKDQNKISCPKN